MLHVDVTLTTSVTQLRNNVNSPFLKINYPAVQDDRYRYHLGDNCIQNFHRRREQEMSHIIMVIPFSL